MLAWQSFGEASAAGWELTCQLVRTRGRRRGAGTFRSHLVFALAQETQAISWRRRGVTKGWGWGYMLGQVGEADVLQKQGREGRAHGLTDARRWFDGSQRKGTEICVWPIQACLVSIYAGDSGPLSWGLCVWWWVWLSLAYIKHTAGPARRSRARQVRPCTQSYGTPDRAVALPTPSGRISLAGQ